MDQLRFDLKPVTPVFKKYLTLESMLHRIHRLETLRSCLSKKWWENLYPGDRELRFEFQKRMEIVDQEIVFHVWIIDHEYEDQFRIICPNLPEYEETL